MGRKLKNLRLSSASSEHYQVCYKPGSQCSTVKGLPCSQWGKRKCPSQITISQYDCVKWRSGVKIILFSPTHKSNTWQYIHTQHEDIKRSRQPLVNDMKNEELYLALPLTNEAFNLLSFTLSYFIFYFTIFTFTIFINLLSINAMYYANPRDNWRNRPNRSASLNLATYSAVKSTNGRVITACEWRHRQNPPRRRRLAVAVVHRRRRITTNLNRSRDVGRESHDACGWWRWWWWWSRKTQRLLKGRCQIGRGSTWTDPFWRTRLKKITGVHWFFMPRESEA